MSAPHPSTVALAEALRRTIAARRDRLVGRQRRRYSAARAQVIDRLGVEYRETLAIAIGAGRSDGGER